MFQKVIGNKPTEPLPSVPTPATVPVSSTPAPASTAAPTYAAASSAALPAAPSRPMPAASRNVLSSDVEIKGTLKFTNDLVVDGRIEGEIESDGNLTIGENARIKAEIRTSTVIIHGKVHGNITAVERIELKAGSEVIGDVKTKVLVMEPGAIFLGKATVGTPSNGVVASAKAPTTSAS